MKEMSKQCRLRRVDGSIQVSWLPRKHAVEGKTLRLEQDGQWESGWCVAEVFPFELDSKVVQERERDFKSHRRATDI